MSPVKRIPLSADHGNPLAWSAIDAEPYCEEPVHHDWKRVHKLARDLAEHLRRNMTSEPAGGGVG